MRASKIKVRTPTNLSFNMYVSDSDDEEFIKHWFSENLVKKINLDGYEDACTLGSNDEPPTSHKNKKPARGKKKQDLSLASLYRESLLQFYAGSCSHRESLKLTADRHKHPYPKEMQNNAKLKSI